MTKIEFCFVSECAVDGCYKKKVNKRMFCKQHEKEYQEGKPMECFYGKIIKKKLQEQSNEQ